MLLIILLYRLTKSNGGINYKVCNTSGWHANNPYDPDNGGLIYTGTYKLRDWIYTTSSMITGLPAYITYNKTYFTADEPSINSSGYLSVKSGGSDYTYYYPAISIYATGGTSTSKAFPTGSINYKVCNVGSVYNTDNSSTPSFMPSEGRFRFKYNPYTYYYTTIPCYSISNDSYTSYYDPSLDSNGAINYTEWNYPARSTYGIRILL